MDSVVLRLSTNSRRRRAGKSGKAWERVKSRNRRKHWHVARLNDGGTNVPNVVGRFNVESNFRPVYDSFVSREIFFSSFVSIVSRFTDLFLRLISLNSIYSLDVSLSTFHQSVFRPATIDKSVSNIVSIKMKYLPVIRSLANLRTRNRLRFFHRCINADSENILNCRYIRQIRRVHTKNLTGFSFT